MGDPMEEDQPAPPRPSKLDSNSSESDSESDDDLGTETASREDLERLMSIESSLKQDVRQYDQHVEYLSLLKQCKLRERLREAREAFSEEFPLSESLWKEWLADELSQVESEDDLERVAQLYEQAVGDYLSTSIWLDYLKFSEASGASAERMSELFEQALQAGGAHLTEGAALWKAYRQFEVGRLEGADATDVEAVQKQAERVRKLFLRQLATPHATQAATLEEFVAWKSSQQEGGDVPAEVMKSYQLAVQAYAARAPYEHAVTPPAEGAAIDAELLAGYLKYIQFEEAQGEAPQVQCVYERAIAIFPVTHELWIRYLRFLDRKLGNREVTRRAYERAMRNCPWVGALWACYLRFEERQGVALDKLGEILEEALSSGMRTAEEHLDVFLAMADAQRRAARTASAPSSEVTQALRRTFQRASETLNSRFPQFVDKRLELVGYWARCEDQLMGDPKAARAVWEAHVKARAYGNLPDLWRGYVAMERARGNIDSCRQLYRRCFTRHFEGPGASESMCLEWLQFEREEGSPADYDAASAKVEPRLAELATFAAEAEAKQAAAQAVASSHEKFKAVPMMMTKDEVKRKRQEADPNYKPKTDKEVGKEKDDPAQPSNPKKRRGLGFTEDKASSAVIAAPKGVESKAKAEPTGDVPNADVCKDEAPKPESAAVLAASGVDASKKPAEGQGPTKEGDAQQGIRYSEDLTLFVSSLSFDVDESDLMEIFGKSGKVKAVRLPRQRETGRSRGMAYIEFEDSESLESGLKLAGTELRGRCMNVAKSKPTSKKGGGVGDSGRGGRDSGRGRGGRFNSGRGRHGGSGGRASYGDQGHHGGGAGRKEQGLSHDKHKGVDPPKNRPSVKTSMFVPRSIKAVKDLDSTPKSNADFRNLLLKKSDP